jgi:hypothetical protein
MSDSNKDVTEDDTANVPLDYLSRRKDDNVPVHDDVVHENVSDVVYNDNDVICNSD